MYLVLAVIAVATFVLYAAFNIIYLIDLKKTSRAMREFIREAEQNITPVLAETRATLQDVRNVASDISLITAKLRTAANAIVTVEKSVQSLYDYYRKGFGEAAHTNMGAVKAGMVAGVLTLIKNLKSRKEDAP